MASPDMITGRTKILGVIGDPVDHSLSPQMQNAALKKKRLNYVYLPFHVKRGELRHAIQGMRALGIEGLNVTIPHKVEVTKYLDELDESARAIKAVNTIVRSNGRLVGCNTDGEAAVDSLKAAGCDLQGISVLMVGAGGAARAIAHSLLREVDRIVIANRTLGRAQKLASFLRKTSGKQVETESLSRKALKESAAEADLLINATPVGMKICSSESLIPAEFIRPGIFVFDAVYNPPETQLLRNAKKVGAKAINGAEMLVRQGALSFQLWTGEEPPLETMKRVLLRELRARRP